MKRVLVTYMAAQRKVGAMLVLLVPLLAGCTSGHSPPSSSSQTVSAVADSKSSASPLTTSPSDLPRGHVAKFDLNVSSGQLVTEAVKVSQEPSAERALVEGNVTLEFPGGAKAGFVFYSEHFLVSIYEGRTATLPNYRAVFVPEGTRRISPHWNSSVTLRENEAPRMIGIVAGGTIPFRIRAQFSFAGTIGPAVNRSVRNDAFAFVEGPASAPTADNPPYTSGSTVGANTGTSSFQLFGLSNMAYDPTVWGPAELAHPRGTLIPHHDCGTPSNSTFDGIGGSDIHDYDPAVAHPKVTSLMLSATCRGARNISVDLRYAGVDDLRPIILVAAFDRDAFKTAWQ